MATPDDDPDVRPYKDLDPSEQARIDYTLGVLDDPRSVVVSTTNEDGSVSFEALPPDAGL